MSESEGLLDRLKNQLTFNLPHVDFEGQKLAERIYQIIMISFAIVGFVWGYMCQQLSQTVIIIGSGFILSCILTLPPWPFYRRHPIDWRQPGGQSTKQVRKKKEKNKSEK
ncbi:signal peptidase complex subunit 1-like [Corticium candelabrum]|uniref:signal peptidase complex subunit 1-like n=1 Tax=Corticium candelabrum TaxID=121492 RepID=UPI002E26E2A2|nr:signal peptidase complex subunit 1-like [Corticium candelabrum]